MVGLLRGLYIVWYFRHWWPRKIHMYCIKCRNTRTQINTGWFSIAMQISIWSSLNAGVLKSINYKQKLIDSYNGKYPAAQPSPATTTTCLSCQYHLTSVWIPHYFIDTMALVLPSTNIGIILNLKKFLYTDKYDVLIK